MSKITKRGSAITALGLALFLGLSALLTPVEAQQLTQEQMRMLQQLSPSEREALMRSMGIKPGQTTPGKRALSQDQEEIPPEYPLPEEGKADLEDEEPRLGPESSIVLTLMLPEELTPEEQLATRLLLEEDRWLAELEGSNTFQLDAMAILNLPGVASIPLGGLTAEEAAKRILAEDGLDIYEATLTYLPLEKTGPGCAGAIWLSDVQGSRGVLPAAYRCAGASGLRGRARAMWSACSCSAM